MLGIYGNLSNDDYHGDKDSISRSGLMQFKKSPASYYHAYINPDRPAKTQTPDMQFGSAFHTYVLEPHLFDKQYFVNDVELPRVDDKPLKKNLQAQYGKDKGSELYEKAKALEVIQKAARDKAIADLDAKAEGKVLFTVDQMDKLRGMKQSVLSHPQGRQLIQGGKIEHSIFWECPHTGVKCKTRPDIWHENMTVDLKTTKDASPRAFQSSIATFGYHVQSAFNREGIYHSGGADIKTHVFLVVEKDWPYAVGVYILDIEALEHGLVVMKNNLRDFARCKEHNDWPGYATETIGLPAWAMNL